MEHIINDVLRLAREGEDIGDTERVDPSATVQAAWEIAADETPTASLVVDEVASDQGEGFGSIEADETRFQQLLENLFRNAVDHGGEDATVRVGRLPDGFYVEDDGPGIPEADREAVLEAGYSTNTDGTGFGLSIVKEVAEAHGWEITVTDGSSGGARFEITGVEFVDD